MPSKKINRMDGLRICSHVQSHARTAAFAALQVLEVEGTKILLCSPRAHLPPQFTSSFIQSSFTVSSLLPSCITDVSSLLFLRSHHHTLDGTTTYGVTAVQGTVLEYTDHHVSSSSTKAKQDRPAWSSLLPTTWPWLGT